MTQLLCPQILKFNQGKRYPTFDIRDSIYDVLELLHRSYIKYRTSIFVIARGSSFLEKFQVVDQDRKTLKNRKIMLDKEKIDFFNENGFLRIPQVFTADETDELADTLNQLVDDWANTTSGWSGPWRRAYMDEETEKKAKLTAMHDLHLYSEAWCRAVTNRNLVSAISQLIGPNVELHHTTMHIKPPETGHLFPMHQDHPFYEHDDGRYVDVLAHLDDTNAENGEIRFLVGSHKQGALVHIRETEDGTCTPHLPTDVYKLEDSVPVPAKRGDVVCFSIHTIHGSYLNRTDKPRRLVRFGYRDPHNVQTAGQSVGRPGLLVAGYRQRREGEELLKMV